MLNSCYFPIVQFQRWHAFANCLCISQLCVSVAFVFFGTLCSVCMCIGTYVFYFIFSTPSNVEDKSTNNPVVKVEGRRPETLTTGLFVLSIPGMATWQTYKPSLIKFEPLVDPGNPKTCLSIKNFRNSRPLAKTVHCINYRYCMTTTIRGA